MPINILDILSYNFAGNSLGAYILALSVFIIAFVFLKILKIVIIRRIKAIKSRLGADFYNLIIKLIKSIDWLFYIFLSLHFSIQFIQLSSGIEKFISYATSIIIVYYAVRIIQALLDYSSEKVIQKGEQGGEFDYSIVNFLNKIVKILIWVVAGLIILQNFGYNVSTLLAGVGIGGIAIAVALQNVLSDMFAAFSIYFDKPFQVGDFIIIGDDMGTVKTIGIKSTRIKTLQGQELIIPNKTLTETRVHNYKRMQKRRVSFNFGVVYETPTEKLKKIPEIIKGIFDNAKDTKLDRVHFQKFGDFSLDFEVVYYLNSSEYNVYMDVQQNINLAIKEKFEQEKIEMAFPTQTIYVNKDK